MRWLLRRGRVVLYREEVLAKALRWSREFSLLSFGFIDELFFVLGCMGL